MFFRRRKSPGVEAAERRERMMQLAVESAHKGESRFQIIERAQSYLAFVSGVQMLGANATVANQRKP